MKQIHSTTIVRMDTNIASGSDIQWIENADGLVTEKKNVILGAYGADCCIVAFWDVKKMGICHAGWRGFLDGMFEQMLNHFEKETVMCHIGPFLHSFEIQQDDCYDRIVQKYGEKYFEHTSGRIFFHFKKAVLNELQNVPFSIDDRSTSEHCPPLASWRMGHNKGNGTQNRLAIWRDEEQKVHHQLFLPGQKIELPH